jgi:hypothetical protein
MSSCRAALPIVHTPWPAVVGFVMAVIVAGLSGYAIGKLSFKVPRRLFRHCHDQLCRR